MKRNSKVAYWGIGIIVLLVILFAIPKITDPNRGKASEWKRAGLDCINEGVTLIAQHNHPRLEIVVDGKVEPIPQNIGIVAGCTAEMHTHDDLPNIHVESPSPEKIFQLKHFFTVWGKTIERSGFTLAMIVDGQPNTELGELILKDKQTIQLVYTPTTTP